LCGIIYHLTYYGILNSMIYKTHRIRLIIMVDLSMHSQILWKTYYKNVANWMVHVILELIIEGIPLISSLFPNITLTFLLLFIVSGKLSISGIHCIISITWCNCTRVLLLFNILPRSNNLMTWIKVNSVYIYIYQSKEC